MLTVKKCDSAQQKSKPYKLFDGEGLYLLVNPNGRKYWRLKYRFLGKEKTYSVGIYPDVSLKKARASKVEARKLLAEDIDPTKKKKFEKHQQHDNAATTFEEVATLWIKVKGKAWKENHRQRVTRSLELDIFPYIGSSPIESISAQDLLSLIRKVEARGANETAHRLLQRCRTAFAFGIGEGACTSNPAVAIAGNLEPIEKQNFPSLKETELPNFFRDLDGYDGDEQTKNALLLIVHTAVRTRELREAQWKEFDLVSGTWSIPAHRMKGGNEHLIPLSISVLEILRQQKNLSEDHFVFPSPRNKAKPISENTMLYALYRMGYHSRATVHGFRATFSTIAHESSLFPSEVIEKQMAHVEQNKVKAAYNKAQYLEQRIELMKWWSQHVDGLREK